MGNFKETCEGQVLGFSDFFCDWIIVWLVVYLPLWKNDFVSWDDDIPNIWKNKKCSKPPTSCWCVCVLSRKLNEPLLPNKTNVWISSTHLCLGEAVTSKASSLVRKTRPFQELVWMASDGESMGIYIFFKFRSVCRYHLIAVFSSWHNHRCQNNFAVALALSTGISDR